MWIPQAKVILMDSKKAHPFTRRSPILACLTTDEDILVGVIPGKIGDKCIFHMPDGSFKLVDAKSIFVTNEKGLFILLDPPLLSQTVLQNLSNLSTLSHV